MQENAEQDGVQTQRADIAMKSANSKVRMIPWVFTATSLALALLPGALALIQGSKSYYDSTLAVLTATLVAIIWYTYFTFETLQHAQTRDAEERRRARQSLASGVLAELRWLEEVLEQVYVEGPFVIQDVLEHPLLQQAITQSTLFHPTTVEKLSHFHSLLRDVRNGMNEYRANPTGIPRERKGLFKYSMQAKAGFVIQALPDVVAALVGEGGVLEKRVLEQPLENGALPSLPPSPFGPRRLTDKPPS